MTIDMWLLLAMLHSLDLLLTLSLLGIFLSNWAYRWNSPVQDSRGMAHFHGVKSFSFFLEIFLQGSKWSEERKREEKVVTYWICWHVVNTRPTEECSAPRTVLIEGEPGMGKTTYFKKYAYDWATQKASTSGLRLHSIQSGIVAEVSRNAFWCLGSHWWAASAPWHRWRSQTTISFYWY